MMLLAKPERTPTAMPSWENNIKMNPKDKISESVFI
jgi:hypothetical protein